MKRWGRLVIGAFCLIAIAACSHVQGYLDIAKEKGMSEAYLQVLKQWTRSQTLYSQFETKAHIGVTLRSPEFNRAYLQEYTRIYQLNADERKQREEMQTAALSEFTEFIFYAYIPNRAENDFDRRGSIWSTFLINDKGEKIVPAEVRRIDPVTPVVTEFFPYINPYYGIAYWLRFSQPQKNSLGNGPLKLVFASVIGKVELEFPGQ
ncbi:MAG: hypothetical protein NT047_13380 [Deltaproteobacteria bacterium]|nr:hypothetical protein [Deltaproteobacteria bacterium]